MYLVDVVVVGAVAEVEVVGCEVEGQLEEEMFLLGECVGKRGGGVVEDEEGIY